MLIDARDRFANRIAEWMLTSTLSVKEMTTRMSQWPDEFNERISAALASRSN